MTNNKYFTTKQRLLTTTATVFAVVLTSTTVANAAENENGKTTIKRDSIVVTGARREQNLQDTQMSISVINPDELSSKGLSRLRDVIAYTPGVQVELSASPGGDNVTMRGVTSLGDTPTVGIYVDNTLLSSNGPWGLGNARTLDAMLLDIERIEFLKGPQGTLYGSTSIGGAIKYITRKPSLDEFRTHAAVDVSSTKDGGINHSYVGRVSAPVIKDKLGLSVAGFYLKNGGFVDRLDAATEELVLEDADDYERYGFSGDLYFKLTDRFSFRALAAITKVQYNGAGFVNLIAPPVAEGALSSDAPKMLQFGVANTVSYFDERMKHQIYSGTLEYQFDGATLVSTGSYTKGAFGAVSDRIDIAALLDSFSGRDPGTTTEVPVAVLTDEEKFTQEITLTSDDSDRVEWMIGGYFTTEDTSDSTSITLLPDPFVFSGSAALSSYEEIAAFGNVKYYFTPDFDITIGARISKNKMTYEAYTDNDRSGFAETPSTTVKDTVSTWSFSLGYRPSENLSLYGRAASGYRPASANSPIAGLIDPEGRIKDFIESDNLWSYEVGAKGDVADGMLNYEVSVWYMTWNDFQSTIILNPVQSASGNAQGGITGKGVELALAFRPIEGLSIMPNVAYAKSTLNDDEPELGGLEGQQVPNLPKWTASAQARYDFTVADGVNAFLGAGVRYRSEARTSFSNGDIALNTIDWPSDAYALVDLSAGVSLDENVTVTLYANNLFDEFAIHNLRGTLEAAVAPGPGPSALPTRPRTIGVNLSLDF